MLPRLQILVSYHFVKKSEVFWNAIKAISPYADILLDSGAFSDFHQGKKHAVRGETFEKTSIEEYIGFLQQNQQYFWYYIHLDVIAQHEPTLSNLKEMWGAGLKPMPVLTIGQDVKIVKDWDTHTDWICVAGGVLGTDEWLDWRLNSIDKACDNRLKKHVLGYGRWPTIFTAPLDSGDSKTLHTGAMFGWFSYYSRRRGIRTAHRTLFSKMKKEDQIRMLGHLAKIGLTVSDLKDDDQFRDMGSIPSLTMVHSYLKFMEHVIERGKRYFIALASPSHLHTLLATLEGIEDGRWHFPTSRNLYYELQKLTVDDSDAFIERLVKGIKEKTNWESRLK